MSTVIDRRLNPRDKTIKNRQKFISRSKDAIKKRVREIIDSGSITDIDTTKTKVRTKGTSEPTFSIDSRTGNKKFIMPGNKQYITGDTVPKPYRDGEGSGREGGTGRGEDDFEFLLTQDEFADFLFEELELPNLIKKQLKSLKQVQYQRAGFKSYGTPNQIDIIKSLKGAIGRRIGMGRPKDEEIEELEETIQDIKAVLCHGTQPDNPEELKSELVLLGEQLEALKAKKAGVPWIDPFDMKYRNFQAVPKPITQAVMFCVMDISASMQEREKDIAKRFFMLLHMFLKRKYEKVEVVFISHHDSAEEVDEDTFFHSRETGGTVVSSALSLTDKIMDERYNKSDWNIYVAQCSDGDNASYDHTDVEACMHRILKKAQYFAYVEAGNIHTSAIGHVSSIWQSYFLMQKDYPHLQIKMVFDNTGIWQVFSELFAKEQTK